MWVILHMGSQHLKGQTKIICPFYLLPAPPYHSCYINIHYRWETYIYIYYVITKLLRQVFPDTHIEFYCLFIEYGNHITFSLQILFKFINFSRGMTDTSDYLRICYTHVRKCNSKVYWKVEILPFGPPSSKETSTIEQNINLAREGFSVIFWTDSGHCFK